MINDSKIQHNQADVNGGGVYYSTNANNMEFHITNSLFYNNSASHSGGGIMMNHKEPIFSETNFTANSAKIYGQDKASYAHKFLFITKQEYENGLKGI